MGKAKNVLEEAERLFPTKKKTAADVLEEAEILFPTFRKSKPTLQGPDYKAPVVAPVVSNPKVKNQGNLLSMDVAALKDKRADVDDQIAALEAEKRTWENEKAIWENSQFRGQKWDEADKQIRDIQARIDTLQKSTFSQDVIDEAQSWQKGVQDYRQQEARKKQLLGMNTEESAKYAERLDELKDLLPTYENEMDFWPEGSEKHAAAKAEYDKAKAEIEQLEAGYSWDMIDEAVQLQEKAKLEGASQYVGFENMSKYHSTRNGQTQYGLSSGYAGESGWGDMRYDVINRNEEAVAQAQANASTSGENLDAEVYALKQMTDEEIAIYNYWYVEDKQKADRYIEMLLPELRNRQINESLERYAQYAQENPAAASAFSVLTSPARGLSYVGQAADFMKTGKIDENAGYNIYTRAGSQIRETVGENIEKALGEKWGKVGSFAYELGMSMGDFLMAAALSGGVGAETKAAETVAKGIATTIMGTGAAAQSVVEAKKRGLSDGQAFALGTIAGVAEAATEKYSIEELLNKAALGKGALTYMLRNAVAEGSEEAASSIINTVADVLISRDRSQWQEAVDAYKAMDYAEDHAWRMALMDQAMAIGLDAIGGAISGGIMGAGGAAINEAAYNLSRPSGAYQQRQEIMDAIMQMAEEDGGFEIDETEAAGDNLPDGGRGRIPGQSAGEQSGTVRQTRTVDQAGRADDRRSRAQVAGLQPVSGKEQNIPRTTANRTFSFMPEETWDDEMRTVYDNVYKRTGKKIEYIIGQIEIDKGNGVVGYARGVWTTDGRIIVQADHPTLSVGTIAGHEKFHSNEFTEDELLQIKQKVIQGHTQESLERVLRDYWTRLKSTIGRDSQGNELTMEQAQRKLLDEVFADADAGINEYDAAKFGNVVREESERILTQRNAPKQQVAQATERTTGPPQQMVTKPKVSAETDARKTELEQVLEQMSEQLAAGNITEEEFDAVYDEIMSQPEMQDSMFSMDAEEKKSVIADLRTYLSGGITAQQLNERIGQRGAQVSLSAEKSNLSPEAAKIKNAARRQRVSVEEYLHRNWELFDVDGQWNEAAREALDDERGVRFSEETMEYDSEGRRLSDEQAAYFKDSKVRDENGNLKVMYHGTPNGDFNVFRDGTYFTDNKEYADRYQSPSASSISTGKVASNPKTFEVYLNIKKPFDIEDPEARDVYINDYIKGGNAMGIDPYMSDAEYEKIGAIDWTEGEDLRDFLIENDYDYDGLVLDEGADGGYGDAVSYRGKSYVVFTPEQVKNVDNQNPTDNPDIRFSEETEAALQDEIKINRAKNRLDELEDILYNGLDYGYSADEIRKLRNEYTKLNADYDRMLRAEQAATVKTPLKTILDNLQYYRRSDLESLAEQASNSAWDDYEDLTTEELIDGLREMIEGWELSPLEMQSAKYGLFVRLPAYARSAAFSIDETEAKKTRLEDYTIDELLALSDEQFTQLYDELGLEPWLEMDGDIMVDEDEAIESASESLGVEPEVIRILFRRNGLGDTYVDESNMAVMTQERIDQRIAEHGATAPDYARRYITRISPKDFIDMTVYEENVDRNKFDSRVRGDFDGRMNDWDYSKQLHDSEEPPVLVIDKSTGKIIGHNGRHRVRALELAGIESVEIEVELHDEDGYLIKYNAQTIPEMAISSQFDTAIETHLYDIIPINKANRSEIEMYYGEQAHKNAGVKFSLDEEKDEEVDRNTLNTKATNYLRGVETSLTRGIKNTLGVTRFQDREDLTEIVRQLSDECLRTGTVQQESIDNLFEQAYQRGIVVDDEFYNENKDIKTYLRKQAISLSEYDQHDIPDWKDWRKAAFGLLNISKDGLPVNIAYKELRDMAPYLFPETITAPSDQIQRMRDVADSIRKVERNLDGYHGAQAQEFKRWAKADFETAIGEHMNELRAVRRYAQERAAQGADIEMPETPQDTLKLYERAKQLRRDRDKVRAKNLLTDSDEMQLGRLHKGEITLEMLPEGVNAQGIERVYLAEREYEQVARVINEYNRRRKAQLKQEADGFLETANEWKDKKTGLQYARETQERNIRDIVPDEALAQRIIDRYFAPVHEAQAKATAMKNEYRQKVKDMNLSRKVEKGNLVSEAHAVQLLGEAEDNIRVLENSRGRMKARDGKTLAEWKAVVENLWAENPKLNEQKIRGAVEEFRKIYDALFQRMNETRVRNGYEPINYRQGYFPHFQPNDTDGILGAFSKALGIDMQTAALPTSINGLTHTFKPGIQWFGNAQERLGFNTAYDAMEGFDKYIEGVADVIFQTDNIQALRALATQIRYRTTNDGIRGQVDQVMEMDLSEEDKKNRIDKIYESGKYALSNFVVDLEEYTNLLANKKSKHDRMIESDAGRGYYKLAKALESRVAANMVAVNPGSWLTNFIPLTQGGAQLGHGNLLQGMWQTLKNYKVHDGFEGKSAFLTNRRGSDPLVKTWSQKASGVMSAPMEYIDTFVADSLVRARTIQNVKAGMSEDAAIREADAWAAGVMADRSKGSLPTLFNRTNPLTKVFTQFQLEVNNQFSYLFKDLPREQKKKGLLALTAALLKFFLGAWLYNEIYEYFIGRRPALDPIGMLNDTVGDLTGYELPNLLEAGVSLAKGEDVDFTTEKQNRYTALENLFVSAAEELPFIGGILGGGRVPIQSALPDFQNLAKAAVNEDWSAEKKWATVGKELLAPATYLLPPFGGGQAKKLLQGIKATVEGGRYTVDAQGNEKLQYPVYKEEAVTAAIFGPTATSTGREWIENDFPTLGINETAAYQALRELGLDEREAYELVTDVRAAEKTETMSEAEHARQVLRDAYADEEAQGLVYYSMLASDKEKELMDVLSESNEDLGSMYQMLDGIRLAENSNAKRQAIMDANLTDEEKRTAYQYMLGTKQDDGSYLSSREDDIDAFLAAGLKMDDFLKAQNEYTAINEEFSGAGDKAVEFSWWLDKQNWTNQQKQTAKEAFKYYSQIPQTETKYDKFTGAGLSDRDAYNLNEVLSELQPEEGKDSVSARQKYKAIADEGLSDEDTMKAFSAVMTESEYKKVTAGFELALSPRQYANVKYTMPQFDENQNGSYSNAEVEAAIDAYAKKDSRLDNGDKAILWQMITGNTSAKNNPYSRTLAERYLEELSKLKGEE